jgi:hypothetical protein
VGLAKPQLEALGFHGLLLYNGSFNDWKANQGAVV